MNGLKFVTIICTVEYVRSGRRNLLLVETTPMYFLQKVATTGKEVASMNPETLGDQFRKHVVHKIPDDNPLKQCLARLSENEPHVQV